MGCKSDNISKCVFEIALTWKIQNVLVLSRSTWWGSSYPLMGIDVSCYRCSRLFLLTCRQSMVECGDILRTVIFPTRPAFLYVGRFGFLGKLRSGFWNSALQVVNLAAQWLASQLSGPYFKFWRPNHSKIRYLFWDIVEGITKRHVFVFCSRFLFYILSTSGRNMSRRNIFYFLFLIGLNITTNQNLEQKTKK